MLLSILVLFAVIKSTSCAVCVYANCEPVKDFLASSSETPQVIGNCASCTECAQLNFPTCTLVHTEEEETGAHCVCGNTLPVSCKVDDFHIIDILDHNASSFDYRHNYMCTFSLKEETLPALEIVSFPTNLTDETATIRIPKDQLVNTRRYADLQFQTISLYLLNGSETEQVKAADHLFTFKPLARIRLDENGDPLSIEPEDAALDLTSWPNVTFPVPPGSPTTIAYDIAHPVHRLILDPFGNITTAKNVSFLYSRLTPTYAPTHFPVPTHDGPNYTVVVLIVVGTILLLGLCCAFVSCKDKWKHRQHQRSVTNVVATKNDLETGKSAVVSGHPQSYTVVKNGGHNKTVTAAGGDHHEKVHLLTNSERDVNASTLPLTESAVGRDKVHTGSLRPTHPATAVVASSPARSTEAIGHPAGSKTDVNVSQRNPTAVEADRRKYLALAKDATVIKAADLDLLESIGSGEFGVIRRGFVFDRTEAMIHCLKPPHKQPTEAAADSLTEKLDASVKAGFHPNIVSLLGLCHEADVLYVCLQMETGPNLRNMLRESRSLDQFLQYTNARGRLSLMSPQRLLNIILGIARGMGHLEENQVLHDNLAAVNIVICDNGSPKIGGFGMATMSDLYMRQLEKNHDQLRWLPPETHETGLFTMKSQTWSFGVVLWEIVTFGGTPYFEMSDDEVVQRVAEGSRLNRPSNCSRQLYDLMEQCWRANGEDRPDFMPIQQHVHELNLDPELHISVVYHDGFKYQPIRETWNT